MSPPSRRVDRPEPHQRASQEGRGKPALRAWRAAGLDGCSLIDSRQRRHDLGRLLRRGGAGRRVNPRRRRLAARAQARDGTPIQPRITNGTVAVHKTREIVQGWQPPGSPQTKLWPPPRAAASTRGPLATRNTARLSAPTGARKESLMALKSFPTKRARTVGHISHDAQLRVDRRVKEILDRREAPVAREAAVERARRAARHLSGG